VESPLENLKPKGEALEERISAQALTADLKTAIVAALTGRESRRWTVGELFDRLNNLGVRCSKPAVAGALGELELEFALCPFLPWNLVEQGTEWTLRTKTELLELLSGVRKLPGVTANTLLTEEAKAVLLVVIGYRKKGGVSKTRIGEILGLEAAPYLEDLCKKELVSIQRPARNSAGGGPPRRRPWPWGCAPTPIFQNSRSSNATLIPRSLLETIMNGKPTWSLS
jgi:chromosome segregation and condensation protein ScpB